MVEVKQVGRQLGGLRRRAVLAGLTATALMLAGCAASTTGSTTSSPTSSAAAATESSGSTPSVLVDTSSASAQPSSSLAGTAAQTAAVGRVATPLTQCTPAMLHTHDSGRLTVGVVAAAAAPWFVGQASAGQGYEAALVYAAAARLGYPRADVVWQPVDRAAVLAGTVTGVDASVGEFPIPDVPVFTVDYSTGYFGITDVVVAKAAGLPAPSLAAVRGLRLATVTSSTAAQSVLTVKPAAAATGFATPSAALAAVRFGTAQAAAVDVLSALAATDLRIVGELPPAPARSQPRQLGLVLPRGSAVTSCLSTAIDLLRVQGTLTSLRTQWLPVTVLR